MLQRLEGPEAKCDVDVDQAGNPAIHGENQAYAKPGCLGHRMISGKESAAG